MTFQFPWYISFIPPFISAVPILIGLFLWKRTKVLAVAIAVFGLLFGALFGPMLFLDRVSLDQKRLVQHTGFWFAQTVKGFELSEVDRVIIKSGRDMKGRIIEIWVAELKNGSTLEVDPGDLWEQNGSAIVDVLEERGIPVVNDR